MIKGSRFKRTRELLDCYKRFKDMKDRGMRGRGSRDVGINFSLSQSSNFLQNRYPKGLINKDFEQICSK